MRPSRNLRAILLFDQEPLDQFASKKLVNLRGIVSIALQVTINHSFDSRSSEIGPVSRARIQKDVLDVLRQLIPVPAAEVVEFVAAQKETLKVKVGERMVELCQPLRHAFVVGIFCFERKLMEPAAELFKNWRWP